MIDMIHNYGLDLDQGLFTQFIKLNLCFFAAYPPHQLEAWQLISHHNVAKGNNAFPIGTQENNERWGVRRVRPGRAESTVVLCAS